MGFELGRILVLPLTIWMVLEKVFNKVKVSIHICKMEEKFYFWRVLAKNRNWAWVQWLMAIIPALREAEARGLLDPRSLRPAWVNVVRPHL